MISVPPKKTDIRTQLSDYHCFCKYIWTLEPPILSKSLHCPTSQSFAFRTSVSIPSTPSSAAFITYPLVYFPLLNSIDFRGSEEEIYSFI